MYSWCSTTTFWTFLQVTVIFILSTICMLKTHSSYFEELRALQNSGYEIGVSSNVHFAICLPGLGSSWSWTYSRLAGLANWGFTACHCQVMHQNEELLLLLKLGWKENHRATPGSAAIFQYQLRKAPQSLLSNGGWQPATPVDKPPCPSFLSKVEG